MPVEVEVDLQDRMIVEDKMVQTRGKLPFDLHANASCRVDLLTIDADHGVVGRLDQTARSIPRGEVLQPWDILQQLLELLSTTSKSFLHPSATRLMTA